MNGMDKKRLVEEGGWREYKIFILESIERIEKNCSTNGSQIVQLMISVAKLKVHARNWGAIAGAISGVILTVIAHFVLSSF